jgi:hypothetical protein
MVVLITYPEINKQGRPTGVRLVSHGINEDMSNVVIPPEPVHEIGIFNEHIGEWVLREERYS